MLSAGKIAGDVVDGEPPELEYLAAAHLGVARPGRGEQSFDVGAPHANPQKAHVFYLEARFLEHFAADGGLWLLASVNEAAGQPPTRKRTQNMIKQQNLVSRVKYHSSR